jgi:hypothetical protein
LPNLVLGILSGTGVPPGPSSPVAGYKLWLDATDSATITASGGDVSQWSDKSGFGSHFTQATSANQPKTGTRTINSKNVIDFDGSNDFLKCNSSTALFKYLHSSTGGTVFIVAINDSNGSFMGNGGASSSTTGIYHAISSNATDLLVTNGGGVPALQFGLTNVGTTAFYLTTKWDAGNGTASNRLKESKNAGAFAGANSNTATPSSGNSSYDMLIGSNPDISGNPTTYLNGAIGEILIYEGILSAGDITLVQSYLATKWGI